MTETVQQIPLSRIVENPRNPRRHFGSLDTLAESIDAQGIIEPLIARPRADGKLELVNGHRRSRAAAKLGKKSVPVIVREMDEETALATMVIENQQREDISPIELAAGYQALMEEHGLSGDEVAKRVGVGRSTVLAAVSLLRLPEPIQQAVLHGKLAADAARGFVGIEGERLQLSAFHEAMKLTKPGEKGPPSRAVLKLIQNRFRTTAKKGQTKHQREVKESGEQVAIRRRVVLRLLARVGELVERKPHLDETMLRLMATAAAETGSDSVREVFQRHGIHAARLGKVGGSQLRKLVVELALVQWVGLEGGEYSTGTRVVAKATEQSMAELERGVAATEEAEALFRKDKA
jgi:ParB/RepB/Spo0J family partition protein